MLFKTCLSNARALAEAVPLVVLAFGVASPLAAPAFAHHSTAMFDARVTRELSGTVTRVSWSNPHTYIYMLIKGPGSAPKEWTIISGTPQLNMRNGWKRDDVKPGDKVTIEIHPDRTGGPAGILRSIKLPDGRVLQGPREFLKVPDAS